MLEFFSYVKLPKTLFLPRYWPCCLMHRRTHLACSHSLLRCPLASFFSFHAFFYFVVLGCVRLSLFSISAASFSSRLGAPTVSLIIIPELLPFRSFSFARSILNVPNANLMACFIVVSFHFVSFSSSIIIGSGYGLWTFKSIHFSPPAYRCIA